MFIYYLTKLTGKKGLSRQELVFDSLLIEPFIKVSMCGYQFI